MWDLTVTETGIALIYNWLWLHSAQNVAENTKLKYTVMQAVLTTAQ